MYDFSGRAMENAHELREVVKEIEEKAAQSGDKALQELAKQARDLADAVDNDELTIHRVNADLAMGNDARAFERLRVPLKPANPPKKKKKPDPKHETVTQEAERIDIEETERKD